MIDVQLAWGADGARALAVDCEVLVLVDVLSFTTCVSVATSLGATVRPLDPSTSQLAMQPGDVLAGPRDGPGPTLSPVSLRDLQSGQRLLLPSPNGSAIASAQAGTACVAASLRNAAAVAEWLGEQAGRVGIVAAGEHDVDGRWRPAYEDLVGAGAVVARLTGSRTPQAEAAVCGFRAAERDLVERLRACRSGADLVERGFADDVTLAGELDVDAVVPLLQDGVFVAPS